MLNAPRRVGLAVFAAGLATTLPLPLYAEYAGTAGAGPLAAAFACYAGVLIVTAPLLGPLPDRIGRRACVLLGLVLAACSTLLLALQPGLWPLAVARMMQGVALGCIANAGGAWAAELAERDGTPTPIASRQGARMVTAGTAGSFGAGPIFTLGALWLMPEWRPPVVFGLHLLLLAVVLVMVARLPETHSGARGALLRLPFFPKGTLASTLAMVPNWGVTGVVLSTVPVALAALGYPRAGAWAVAFMVLAGTAAQYWLGRLRPLPALRLGLGLLVVGSALVFIGATQGSMLALLLGAPITGVAAYGLVYLGGLAAVAEAAPTERPRGTAGFFLIGHVGFSVVPLLVGFAADAVGATAALAGLWVAVTVASLALMWVLHCKELDRRRFTKPEA